MEPRLFSHGYGHIERLLTVRPNPLQWSHGFSAVDTGRTIVHAATRRTELQWSHGFSAVDTGSFPREGGCSDVASMEPRLFSRGYVTRLDAGRFELECASMEPRLFSRGYHKAVQDVLETAIASMEPRLFSRGYSAHLEPLCHKAFRTHFRAVRNMSKKST